MTVKSKQAATKKKVAAKKPVIKRKTTVKKPPAKKTTTGKKPVPKKPSNSVVKTTQKKKKASGFIMPATKDLLTEMGSNMK